MMEILYRSNWGHRKGICLAICFLMLPVFLLSEVDKDRVLPSSSGLALGRLCVVTWNHSRYLGKILAISEESAAVKLFDRWKNISQWPEIILSIDCIKPFELCRWNRLEELIASLKNIHLLQSPTIEQAGLTIDRAWFCPKFPYDDHAVTIGHNACISSPHMHFCALELSQDKFDAAASILDVGSGSGYLVAMFAHLSPSAKVVGVEYLQDLVTKSRLAIEKNLTSDLQKRITILEGDGEEGAFTQAPFDVIHVGFMCEQVPAALIDQLRPGGRMIIPVGNAPSRFPGCLTGEFTVIDKLEDGSIQQHEVFPCSYVPSVNSEKYQEFTLGIVKK